MALKTGALIIAADNKKREKPIYMCEALSLPLISYVKSYAEKADAEKTAIIIESDSSGVEAIKGDSRVFVSPDAENDSDFLLAADGFADEFDYVYVLYGNVPLMSGSSLKNALSLCVNEGNEAAAVFSRQPNGEDVTGAYVFSSKKLHDTH